jgi:asparagine synthetase B (glutamine-hydrolysing)
MATTLTSLVDKAAVPLDAHALAAWVLRGAPNRAEATPYWGIDCEQVDPPPRPPRGPCSGLADAPAFLRRALEDAVDVALAGTRRVAVSTGGGLDSSVLLALAVQWARRSGGSAFAVSLDFEGPGDDRPHLAALERHLGCEVIRVSPEQAAPRMAMIATGADSAPVPFATMPMEVELCVRAREHGAERLLSGAGGDELFGGSPQSLAELARRGHPVLAVRAARRLRGFGRVRAPSWSWVMRPLLGRAQPVALRVWRARRAMPAQLPLPTWAGPVARSFLEESRRRAIRDLQRRPTTASQRLEALRRDTHRVTLAWSRHQGEQASGIDCWDPYLDLDLAASVTALEPYYLLFGDRWRGLLRASMQDLLPESLRERMDKASFEPALRRFMDAAGGFASLRSLASGRALASLGLIEPGPFAAAFEHFVAAPEDGVSWMALWSALSVEAFVRGRGL